jgi:hypothetical protein
VTRISALWRLDHFLDRDDRLSADQRLAPLSWILELQDDPLPPPAVEVTDARGRSIRVALLDAAGVAVTYRLMAGRPRLMRLDRLP